MSGRMNGTVAIVTGAGGGIGRVIVDVLTAEGSAVVATDVARLPTELGALQVVHDVTNPDDWDRVIAEVQSRFGRLDVLVNSAGLAGSYENADPEHASLDDWRRVNAVNVESVLIGCQRAIPVLAASGGGSIVNISSTAALVPTATSVAYGASKAAVTHLTRSIAQYCAQQHPTIRCNSVHPGPVMTSMFIQIATDLAAQWGSTVDEAVEHYRARMPGGQFIDAEDVARAVLYFASDDARRVSGAQLVVDGGATVGGGTPAQKAAPNQG